MNPTRLLPVLIVLALIALAAFLFFDRESAGPLGNDLVAGTDDSSKPDSETGDATDRSTIDASANRSVVDAPTSTLALDPGIRAALSGFRGRVVTPELAGMPQIQVELFRFAADSVITTNPGELLAEMRYEPDVDAGDTKTKDDGAFEITGVWPRGFYLLRAGKGSDSIVLRVVDKIPGPGEIVDLGDIIMQPSGIITGVVVDDEGQPVQGALVRAADIPGALLSMAPVEQFDPTGGIIFKPGGRMIVAECPPWVEQRFEQLPIPMTRTDADGAFRLTGVVPGGNVLVVNADALLPQVKPRVKVDPGEEKDIGRIRLREGETLYGRVVDQNGDAVPNAEILAAPVGAIPVHFARFAKPTDADGVFEATGFPNQNVIVAARRSTRDPWVLTEPQPITRDIEVVLPSQFTISVRLTSEAGLPIEQPKFELFPGELGDGAVEMAMWGATQPIDLSGRVDFDEEQGIYVIREIPAGEFALLAHADGHAIAGTNVEMEGPVEVEMKLSTARVFDVQVIDASSQPISSASIYVEARGGRPRIPEMPIRAGATDEDGKLTVDRVFASEVRLTAYHPAYGNAHADGIKFPLEAPIVLQMEEPGTLEGVLTENGQPPLPGKWTLTIDRDWDRNDRGAMPNMPTLTVADIDGKFRVTGLRPGKYEIRPIDSIASISSPGAILGLMQSSRMMGFREDREFEIRSGETTSVEIDTEAEREIEGPTGQLMGTVLVDGAPGTKLSVMTWSGGGRSVSEVDANGRFDLGTVKAENMTIQVTEMPDSNTLSMRFSSLWSQQVEVKENEIKDITIQISLSSASGYVTTVDGTPAVTKQVSFNRISDDRSHAWFSATTDANGFFQLDRIPAGKYHVQVKDETSKAEMSDVVVEAGVQRSDIRLRLERMQQVSGTVDTTPFGDADIEWMWLRFERVAGQGTSEQHWVGCNGNGHKFTTTELSPGTWRVRINGPAAPDGQRWYHDGEIVIGAADMDGIVIRPILKSH